MQTCALCSVNLSTFFFSSFQLFFPFFLELLMDVDRKGRQRGKKETINHSYTLFFPLLLTEVLPSETILD